MLYCGIDSSDQSLEYHLRDSQGKVLCCGQVVPNVEGLAELFARLDAHDRPEQIGVALECAHGAWVQLLLDQGYSVFPVNPKTVGAFREALSAAGEKCDSIDAGCLALFLATCHHKLHPLHPDAPDIVVLRFQCQDRLRFVEERTAKLNELQALIKIYYPAFLGLFGDLSSRIALDFLDEFPTQDRMRAMTSRRLENWLKRHHYSCLRRLEDMKAILSKPVLPVPAHLQSAKAPRIQFLAQALIALEATITGYDREITRMFEAMPEADWIGSLPGAGTVLAPALLACVGRDPNRFAEPAQAQALIGTAPVSHSSGKSYAPHFRRGCWKFARRTFQLFAYTSLQCCTWAQELYSRQIASGHGHHAALRVIAHKWIKIILAMKRSGQPYNEAIFTNSQSRHLLKAPGGNLVPAFP